MWYNEHVPRLNVQALKEGDDFHKALLFDRDGFN